MNKLFDETLDHRFTNSYRWEQPEGHNDIIGLGTADLDYQCPECVKRACLQVAKENTYNYRKKTKEYYESIDRWYQRHYGIPIEKEWVFNVPGTIAAIQVALRMLTKRHEHVIMQSPTFSPLVSAVKGAGCTLVRNEMIYENGEYRVDLDAFERQVRGERPKIFLLVNPHNPTGHVFTKYELERMINICYENQVTIISDEVHSLVIGKERKHIPIISMGERAKEISILITSFSKGFNIMSLPHALLVIPDETYRRKWQAESDSYSFGYATNSFAMAAFSALLGEEADDWLGQLTDYIQDNIETCLNYMKSRIPDVTAIRPDGGYLIWIDCSKLNLREGMTPARFLYEHARLRVSDGGEFGEKYDKFVRINVGVTKKVLEIALRRMEDAIKENT